jgi:hypothetical protein
MMARKTKPGDFRLKITTSDGNTMEVHGTFNPLTTLAVWSLVAGPDELLPVVRAELDLLRALNIRLDSAAIAYVKIWGVAGQALLDEFVAAGGRI